MRIWAHWVRSANCLRPSASHTRYCRSSHALFLSSCFLSRSVWLFLIFYQVLHLLDQTFFGILVFCYVSQSLDEVIKDLMALVHRELSDKQSLAFSMTFLPTKLEFTTASAESSFIFEFTSPDARSNFEQTFEEAKKKLGQWTNSMWQNVIEQCCRMLIRSDVWHYFKFWWSRFRATFIMSCVCLFFLKLWTRTSGTLSSWRLFL